MNFPAAVTLLPMLALMVPKRWGATGFGKARPSCGATPMRPSYSTSGDVS